MKKFLLILFLYLFSIRSFAQIKEFYESLGLNIPFNELSNYEGEVKVTHDIFKSIKINKNQGEIISIFLNFKSVNALKKSEKILVDQLSKYFGKVECFINLQSGKSYSGEKGVESVRFDAYIKNDMFSISAIRLYYYKPYITSEIDEFTNVKLYHINGGDLGIQSPNGTYYHFDFIVTEQDKNLFLFMLISTKNEDWKFISKILVKTDNETLEYDAESKRELISYKKLEEKVIVYLSPHDVKAIITSKDVKIRISGRSNEDMLVTENIIHGLRELTKYTSYVQ